MLKTFYFDLNLSWTQGIFVTHQGPLFNLPTVEISTIPVSALPPGTYTFYFAVDLDMNGTIDLSDLFFDSVVVNIAP